MSKIYRVFLQNETAVRRIFARYFREGQEIEDLTQEIFIKCFAAELKTDIREPKAFLLRAAKNLALSERKKKRRTTTDYMEDSGGSEVFVDEEQATADVMLDGQRKLAALSMALASLPPDYRRAFVMRKIQGLKLAQIATRLNVTVRTAQNRVARALVLCEQYLLAQGYEPAEFGAIPPRTADRNKPSPVVAITATGNRTGDDSDG